MPCSLHSRLAYCSASRSLTPLAAPSAQAAFVFQAARGAPVLRLVLHREVALVHLADAAAGDGAAEAGPVGDEVLLAVGLCAAWHGLGGDVLRALELHVLWLRVGSAPISLMTFISTWVP